MEENIYHPFTESEYLEMYDVVNPIVGEMPSDGVGPSIIWNSFNKLTGSKAPQPCTCKSTVKYWVESINELKGFIEHVDKKKEELSNQTQTPTE